MSAAPLSDEFDDDLDDATLAALDEIEQGTPAGPSSLVLERGAPFKADPSKSLVNVLRAVPSKQQAAFLLTSPVSSRHPPPASTRPAGPSRPAPANPGSDDIYGDDDFLMSAANLEEIQALEFTHFQRAPVALKAGTYARAGPLTSTSFSPSSSSSSLSRFRPTPGVRGPVTSSTPRPPALGMSGLRQTHLLGGLLDETEFGEAPNSSQSGMHSKEGKKWDRTHWAKSGVMRRKEKAKAQGGCDDDEDYGPEDVDDGNDGGFEQFPAPFVNPLQLLPPLKHKHDPVAVKTWIYPTNLPFRDYQYNIIRRCLYQNTLVCLPTGLGKTFIAGVLMLNYTRWFPTGKIFFIAPTKPLVNQQAEAFPQTCGFIRSQITVLTGDVVASQRSRLYESKTVFFMTAQTMQNDLSKGVLNAQDVIMLVIDEAHRATGEHSYNQVVRSLQARNHHFRILALTATPCSQPEKVQELVDAIHISHVELRTDDSFDLRPYVFKKKIEQISIPLSRDIIKIKDMLTKIMQPMMAELQKAGVIYERAEPATLSPFICMQASKKKENSRFRWTLSQLGVYARAMVNLLLYSLGMCEHSLESAISKNAKAESSKKSSSKAKAIMNEIAVMKARGGYVGHAKMDRVKGLLLEHFSPREDDNDRGDIDPGNTRVMVFCSFRACLTELVSYLNQEQPLLRVSSFIGQSKSQDGIPGMKQKEQLQVIRDFKAGKINVIVATSIGEEGLDIGSVDKVILYDSKNNPLSVLQRIGRTGRKREGSVIVLSSEGREEQNWDKAQDKYAAVQKEIEDQNLELYDDVPRLLPDGIKPECVKQVCEIDDTPIVSPEKPPRAKRKPRVSVAGSTKSMAKGKKQAAADTEEEEDDDDDDNTVNKPPQRGTLIPKGAVTGFVSASALVASRRRNVVLEEESEDSDEAAIAAGPGFLLRRSLSAPSCKPKGNTRASLDDGGDPAAATRPVKRAKSSLAAIQALAYAPKKANESNNDAKLLAEDPGLVPSARRTPPRRSASSDCSTHTPFRESSPDPVYLLPKRTLPKPQAAATIARPPSVRARSSPTPSPPRPSPPQRKHQPDLFAPASSQELAFPPPSQLSQSIRRRSSSRTPPHRPSSTHFSSPGEVGPGAGASAGLVSPPPDPAAQAGFDSMDMAWVLGPDEDIFSSQVSPAKLAGSAGASGSVATPTVPPPAVPATSSSPQALIQSPLQATQHPIRRAGARPRPKATVSSSPVAGPSAQSLRNGRPSAGSLLNDSPYRVPAPRAQGWARRVHQHRNGLDDSAGSSSGQLSSIIPAKRRKPSGPAPADVRRYFDKDAQDERLSGVEYSSEDEDRETEADRRFAGDFQPTQAPRGYNQRNAYLAGILTQVGVAGDGPKFARPRIGEDVVWAKRQRRSSESVVSLGSAADDDGYGTDEDSFVVGDEESLELEPSSEF